MVGLGSAVGGCAVGGCAVGGCAVGDDRHNWDVADVLNLLREMVEEDAPDD